MNENKNPNKFKIPLVIVALLIVLLITFGAITYFIHQNNNKNKENIYYSMLNKFSEGLINNIDKKTNFLKKATLVKGDIKINVDTTNNSLKSLAKVLNNLDIKYQSEIDTSNRIINTNYELNYQNNKITDLKVILKNDDGYLNLGTLFSKNIKVSDTHFKEIWDKANTTNLKTIIKEMTKIIRNNLKDPYFKEEKTQINNLEVTNYIMEISQDELINLKSNILNSMLYNNNLLQSIASITNSNVEKVKETINNYLVNNNITNDLICNVYINKDQIIEKVVIKYQDTYNFIRTKDNTYELNIQNKSYGTIAINNGNLKFNLNTDNNKLQGNLENNNLEINIKNNDYNYSIKNDNQRIIINYDAKETKYNIEISYNLEEIDKTSEIDLSTYITSSLMTSEDYLEIYKNLMNNPQAKLLIEDLGILSLDNLFGDDTEFGSGTEEISL